MSKDDATTHGAAGFSPRDRWFSRWTAPCDETRLATRVISLISTHQLFSVMCAAALMLSGCKKEEKPAPPTPKQGQESLKARYLSLMNVGKAHYENREADKAIESFAEAIKLLPTEVAARLNLARAYLLARKNELVLAETKEVLVIDRHSTAAHYLAGIAHLRLGQARRAIAQLEEAARQDPSSATIHFQLASALRLDGQLERSAEELRTVLALDEKHWSAHYQLAQAARRAKDAEGFRRHMAAFEKYSKGVPDAKKTPDVLERCKYTVAEVPTEVHQPAEKPIEVRFVAKPIPLPKAIALARPIALIDIEADPDVPRLRDMPESGVHRDQDVVISGDDGKLWLLHNRAGSFEAGSEPLASMPKGVANTGRVADFDNDRLLDILAYGPDSTILLKQHGAGQFKDVTRTAGLDGAGARDAIWIDYDHDGDLDLLVVTVAGGLLLWQNQGNGTFVDQSELAGIPPGLTTVVQVRATDFDGDEALDVIVASADGPAWQLHNDGLGIFLRADADPPWPSGHTCYAEDFDNDLRRDLMVGKADRIKVVLSSGRRDTIMFAGPPAMRLYPLDYDNDGWLDLLVVTAPDTGPDLTVGLRLFRNAGAGGWRDMTESCGLLQVRFDARSMVHVADFDGDGDSDLLFAKPHGGLMLAVNEGGNANRQLKLQLVGTKSNRSGIGTLIEIRTGGRRMSRTVSELPIEIGVGDLKQLDSVRTIWTNGIVKNDIWVKTPGMLKVEEPFVSAGSCPYVYAWDGQEFRFITDILGGSPLGLPMRRGRLIPADTYEYIWLGGHDTFRPRDGRYLIRITDELREVLYLDYVRLVAVDHPPDTEVHPTDKLEPPAEPVEPAARAFARSELWILKDRRDLLRATDNAGDDWTEELRAIDGLRSEPPALRIPQLRGLAHEHSYTLDFGSLDVDQPLVLALSGWLMWGDAGVSVAAGQNPELPNPWPKLEAWAGGSWQPVGVTVGAPSGKPKTILVDLSDALPEGTTRLRLTIAFEIYWDRIALFLRGDNTSAPAVGPASRAVTLQPIRAELRWRGFPRQARPGPRDPIVPVADDILPAPPWRTAAAGWCTRYGDVLELLTEVDDRFVILNGGDAVVIEFPDALSALPDGWLRSFFMICDGWDKDGDYNVRYGNTVEPLPFHGMDDQRYGEEPRRMSSDDWIERFNTRWVGP